MKIIHHTLLAASVTAMMSATAFAGDVKPLHGVEGSLGSSPVAADIMLFKCGTMEGITVDHAHASVADLAPVAKPRLNVMMAKWNGKTCVNWTTPAGDAVDDDVFSSDEVEKGMPAVGGKYCIAVFKTPDNQNAGTGPKTSKGAENYELDTGCGQEGIEDHPASTLIKTFING